MCPVGPKDTRSENQIFERTSWLKQQSHGDADDKAQPLLHITVPAIKHRSLKHAALQTLNRQCCWTHRQINVRLENNHDYVKILSKKTQWASSIFPSISICLPFHYIQLRFPYNFFLLASELYWRKSGHRDPWKKFQVSEDNTSWATCQH